MYLLDFTFIIPCFYLQTPRLFLALSHRTAPGSRNIVLFCGYYVSLPTQSCRIDGLLQVEDRAQSNVVTHKMIAKYLLDEGRPKKVYLVV